MENETPRRTEKSCLRVDTVNDNDPFHHAKFRKYSNGSVRDYNTMKVIVFLNWASMTFDLDKESFEKFTDTIKSEKA